VLRWSRGWYRGSDSQPGAVKHGSESDDRDSARIAGTGTQARRVGSIPNTLNVLCQCVYLVSDSKSISEVTRKYLESSRITLKVTAVNG
jgi:hypothetical protein